MQFQTLRIEVGDREISPDTHDMTRRTPLRAFIALAAAAVFAALALSPLPAAAQSAAGQSAVIVNYERFAESGSADTSVRAEQFEAHVKTLSSGRYAVRPVAEIAETLFSGGTLSNRTVGIAVDKGYRSFIDFAWPRLQAAGLPVTLFVATDPLDKSWPGYVTWDEVRGLRDAGVAIGLTGASERSLVSMTAEERRDDLARAVARYRAELGQTPTLYAYPLGEMSMAAAESVAAAGFQFGFGLHSGAVNATQNRLFLPRYAITEGFAGESEFAMRLDSLGLPMAAIEPADPYLAGVNPPDLILTLDSSLGRIAKPTCFHSQPGGGSGEASVEEAGENRYRIVFANRFRPGAWRLNCTMPTGGKRWRWFGMQFFTAGG